MFNTPSTFELTRPKLILCLFLALAFIGKASGDRFGCEFTDSYYTTQDPKGNPIWSDVAMESISDVENFEDFKKPFTKLFSEPSLMNELALFTEFVGNYKYDLNVKKPKIPCIYFQNYFDNYNIPIEPFTRYDTYYEDGQNKRGRRFREPASYLIQELHTLMRNAVINGKSVSPFIVSAYVDPIGVTFNPMSYEIPEKISNRLLKKRVQEHLAAIINIKIGGRTGYILIDPGYSNGPSRVYSPFAACIMKDGNAPHGEFIRGNSFSRMTLAFGDENGNPFILVKHKHIDITMHSLYYVGKPYCSFKENTIKPMLLRQYHGIILRDNQGEKQGYLQFMITPSGKPFHNGYFYIDETSNPKTITATPKLTSGISESLQVSDSQRDNIVKQLIFVQKDVLWNKQFLGWLTGLTKKFDLDRESDDGQDPKTLKITQ